VFFFGGGKKIIEASGGGGKNRWKDRERILMVFGDDLYIYLLFGGADFDGLQVETFVFFRWSKHGYFFSVRPETTILCISKYYTQACSSRMSSIGRNLAEGVAVRRKNPARKSSRVRFSYLENDFSFRTFWE